MKLYWVGTRLYDPETGRFVCADDVSNLNMQVIGGMNLFAYCLDNPIINNFDLNVGSADRLKYYILSKFSIKSEVSSVFRWESQPLDIGTPEFLSFTNEKFAIIDWGMSLYRGALYIDGYEDYSLYVAFGNASAFVGYNREKRKIGIFADANVLEVGYDGRYIDASISLVGAGVIIGFYDGKLQIKVDPLGFFGFSISIDVDRMLKDWLRIGG